MRLFASWYLGLTLATLLCSAQFSGDSEPDELEPVVTVTASFPENNPFGQIVNGERNRINLLVENASEENTTLISVAGSFLDVNTGGLIKNSTTIPYGLRLLSGTKLQIPYQFHSEFKPGDIRLYIWLTHMIDDQIYQVTAYDSVVTVVEPEISFFDYQIITTYIITAAFIGGLGYFAFITFFPKPKKARTGTKQPVIQPTSGATVTTAEGGVYEEEWIPEHHLRTRTTKKKSGVISSGDELSGGETSGDGKRRKGRK